MKKFNQTEKKVLKLASEIKLVVKMKAPGKDFQFGGLYFVEPVDLKDFGAMKDAKSVMPARCLKKASTIYTLHSPVGYKGAFLPNLFECLQQIDEKVDPSLKSEIVAFSVAPTIKWDKEMIDGDFEYGKITLYKLKDKNSMPKKVANQDVVYNGERYNINQVDEIVYGK
ncbi:MAG: hypothetical protein MJ152_04890 [Clostridia bacterium]|nr:hypothetical protein [Clostridia bacterium]